MAGRARAGAGAAPARAKPACTLASSPIWRWEPIRRAAMPGAGRMKSSPACLPVRRPIRSTSLGQHWGLTSFSPRALQRHGYRAFIEMLRANLRHAGGIRIDHALGLARMWLVPRRRIGRRGRLRPLPLRRHDAPGHARVVAQSRGGDRRESRNRAGRVQRAHYAGGHARHGSAVVRAPVFRRRSRFSSAAGLARPFGRDDDHP